MQYFCDAGSVNLRRGVGKVVPGAAAQRMETVE
jgi:hypothetical protein